MPLCIEHPDVDRLAEELARLQGLSVPEAVVRALRKELEREERKVHPDTEKRVMAIIEHYHTLPLLDARSADEIIGYDENGLPS